jgi:hypothetical protein
MEHLNVTVSSGKLSRSSSFNALSSMTPPNGNELTAVRTLHSDATDAEQAQGALPSAAISHTYNFLLSL